MSLFLRHTKYKLGNLALKNNKIIIIIVLSPSKFKKTHNLCIKQIKQNYKLKKHRKSNTKCSDNYQKPNSQIKTALKV